MQTLQFSVTVPHYIALQDYDKMIEVNLKKEKYKAVKTAVSLGDPTEVNKRSSQYPPRRYIQADVLLLIFCLTRNELFPIFKHYYPKC